LSADTSRLLHPWAVDKPIGWPVEQNGCSRKW